MVTSTNSNEKLTIDGQELTKLLSRELLDLRNELLNVRSSREHELKCNLLTYIQSLPENELLKLSSDISEEVLQAIRLLVDDVMEKVGLNEDYTLVEVRQSQSQLEQLCMWQIISGYKLRELEALEDGASIN